MEREVADGLLGVNSALTTVAHELKSPLALIRQLSLFMEEGECSSAEVRQISRQISQTSDRALRLASDLTKVARLEDAMFELAPVNPHKICDEVLMSLGDLYRLNRRNLCIRYTNRSKLVVANPELLKSVVYNLCDNALHYSGEDVPSELFVKNASSSRIRVGVRDYGPSLPKDIWRSIKNGGIDNPTPIQIRPQSSGLGLYIVSRFIKIMNGKLGVVRHKDGTTFYVDLHVSSQMSLL